MVNIKIIFNIKYIFITVIEWLIKMNVIVLFLKI